MATKVFISYAHESESLSNEVLKFSNELRANGIDSEIDQYEEAPPEGWPKWMMRQIQISEYVLVVCSELFFNRANDFSGSDSGLGVKWETSLILQQLYALSTENIKFIPVIFGAESKSYIPLPLQPYTYYQVNEEENKKNLIDRLKGKKKTIRPPLGEEVDSSPLDESLMSKERKSIFFSSIIDIDMWNKAQWSGMAFVSDPALIAPPIACFMFENEEEGEKIFSILKREFGEIDNEEEIRLSFVEGTSDSNPRAYKAHFGSSIKVLVNKIDKYGLKPDATSMTVSRIKEMYPPSDPSSLTIFKHAYNHFKEYFITNLVTHNGKKMPSIKNIIRKKEVYFRKKAEIIGNRNDEDYVVVVSNDKT